MDLIDEKDLVAIADRHDAEAGNDHLADVVDAGVGRRIDLEHVDVATFRNLDAGVARAAGVGGRPVLTAQRPRQDARGRRLADAAGSGEHERLRQAAARERIAQGARHRLLPDDIVEALRAPFPRDHLVRHRDLFGNYRVKTAAEET